MHVRRALLLLSAEGIVDLHSNRGAYIACPNQQETRDIFDARLMIVPPLIRKLAMSISSHELKNLSDHLDQENQARQQDQRTDLIRLSGEFHVKLAEAYGNPSILKTMRELVTKTSLIVGMFGTSSNACCLDDAHHQILQAIQNNNADQAHAMTITHLNHIWDGLNMNSLKSDDDLEHILGGALK